MIFEDCNRSGSARHLTMFSHSYFHPQQDMVAFASFPLDPIEKVVKHGQPLTGGITRVGRDSI